MGNFAYGVAIAVYAYQHGGATAVGVVTAIRQVIAALIAPFAASLADRFPRERVMLGSDLGRLVSVGATAALVVAHSPSLIVYVVADDHDDPRHDLPSGRVGADAAARALARGADGGERLVEHLRQPRRRSSARRSQRSCSRSADLGWRSRSTPRRSPGARTSSRGCTRRRSRAARGRAAHGPRRAWSPGFRAIAAEPRLRLLIGLYGAQCFVAGALGVFVVVIALKLLGLGTAGVGLLQAACGIGALAGAAVALSLVARARIAADFAIGSLLWGAAAVARRRRADDAIVAALALGIVGVGNTLVDISAMTLLQRAAPPDGRGARLRLSRERDRRLDRPRRARDAGADRAARRLAARCSRSARCCRCSRSSAGAASARSTRGTGLPERLERRSAPFPSSHRCRSKTRRAARRQLVDVTLPAQRRSSRRGIAATGSTSCTRARSRSSCRARRSSRRRRRSSARSPCCATFLAPPPCARGRDASLWALERDDFLDAVQRPFAEPRLRRRACGDAARRRDGSLTVIYAAPGMKARIWGCRGSLSTPGAATVRYGGNTSCVEVRTATGGLVVLDAGTGVTLARRVARRRGAGRDRPAADAPAPRPHRGARLLRAALRPGVHDPDLGPATGGRLAREGDLDLPLAAVLPGAVRAVPARGSRSTRCRQDTWQIDDLRISTVPVCHPGPTVGYRLSLNGNSLAYIPDNEPALDRKSGLARRRRRRRAVPRRAVHRRRVRGPRRLGALGAQRFRRVSRRGRAGTRGDVPPRSGPQRRATRVDARRGPRARATADASSSRTRASSSSFA